MDDVLRYHLSRPLRTPGLRPGLPASKSIANRLLVMQRLSGGSVRLLGEAGSEDILLMRELLEKTVAPAGGPAVVLDCRNAGTVLRFLTAVLAITPGKYHLTGSERMCERPVFPLVAALRSLGANISYSGKPGHPPLEISGIPLEGGRVSLPGNLSSQFISALLMIAPLLPGGLEVGIDGQRVSEPYIDMTARLMQQAGIRLHKMVDGYRIPSQPYGTLAEHAEADWSSASYWYELASLSGEEIFLEGLKAESLQGDRAVAGYYRRLGLDSRFTGDGVKIEPVSAPPPRLELDLSGEPDLAPALACSMAGLGVEGRLTGLHHLRIKESDRLAALTEGLNAMGFPVRHDETSLIITGTSTTPKDEIALDSGGDHRMAMAFAMMASKLGRLSIGDPLVTGKSYPGFWDEIRMAGFLTA